MDYQFYLSDSHPSEILGHVFIHNQHSYRVHKITKTWGISPVLLGYVELMDENGEISTFLLKIKPNLKSTNLDNNWIINITNIPF